MRWPVRGGRTPRIPSRCAPRAAVRLGTFVRADQLPAAAGLNARLRPKTSVLRGYEIRRGAGEAPARTPHA